MDDDVSIDELRDAVENLHGVPAVFLEAVEVDERFDGQIVWQGTVKVFALIDHPSGRRPGLCLERPHRRDEASLQGGAWRLPGGRPYHGRPRFDPSGAAEDAVVARRLPRLVDAVPRAEVWKPSRARAR